MDDDERESCLMEDGSSEVEDFTSSSGFRVSIPSRAPTFACSICDGNVDQMAAALYPNYVCQPCGERALNAKGEPATMDSASDRGDNPVFVNGIKCFRRYKFGGFLTMRDAFGCEDAHIHDLRTRATIAARRKDPAFFQYFNFPDISFSIGPDGHPVAKALRPLRRAIDQPVSPERNRGVAEGHANEMTASVRDSRALRAMARQAENRRTFERVTESECIEIRRAPIFEQTPKSLPAWLDFDRVEGMLLGLAVGDALGATTESMLPGTRRERFGEIRDYLANRHAADSNVGLPSDDTQLTFWTLEQMLVDEGLNPSNVAARFASRRIFGIGSTLTDFLDNLKAGVSWERAGVRSAGNGALMRISPVVLPFLRNPSSGLWVDAALAGMITHNDSASISSCIAFVRMIWDLLALKEAPPPVWWVESFVETARSLECNDSYRPRGGVYLGYTGTMWRFVEEHLLPAYREGLTVLEAGSRWHSGAYLLETVPTVLYILMRHGDDFEEAVVRAANDTKDNDTIAAIVGSVLGALHGKSAIPPRWLGSLLGRTQARDDGRVFNLISEARARWWLIES
jgi:ADP-ribosylglycohydrolase